MTCTYFEHVARSVSWPLVDWPDGLTVVESELSPEQAEMLRQQIEALYPEAAHADPRR
jgi:hypothetical protein